MKQDTVALAMGLLSLFPSTTTSSQVVINEVLADNSVSNPDENGEYSDWIELFNRSNTAVDLKGFGLSDDLKEPFKWQFAGGTLQPGAYLTVIASGNNRQANGLAPDSLSSLLAWFSASSIDTTDATQAIKNGSSWTVNKWYAHNKAFFAGQSSSAARPTIVYNSTGNRPAILFNGNSQFLKTNVFPPNGNKPRTIIVVINNTNITTANQQTSNYIFQYGNYDNTYSGFFEGINYGSRIGTHYWKGSFRGDIRMNENQSY